MKQFSAARNTQRDSQSCAEKRGGRKEIEVTWRRKGRVKERAIKPVIKFLSEYGY